MALSYHEILIAHSKFMEIPYSRVYDVVLMAVKGADCLEGRAAAVFVFLVNWNRRWYEGRFKDYNGLGDHLLKLVEALRQVDVIVAGLRGVKLVSVNLRDPMIRSGVERCFRILEEELGSTVLLRPCTCYNLNCL